MFHLALSPPRSAVRRLALALAGGGLLGAGLVAPSPAQAAIALHGGWGITRTVSTGQVLCTDGFHARSSDGTPVVITAGHCGGKEIAWRSEKSGQKIGAASRSVFRTDSSEDDWAFIRSNGTHWLAPTVVDAGTVRYVARVGEPWVGLAVCTTGRASGTRCGKVTRVKSNGIVITDIASRHGDSGSPLYRRIPGSSKVSALGILSYGDEKTYSAFQLLTEVLGQTGATVRTG